MGVKPRSEVPEAQRWNAESVFAGLDAWDDAFERTKQQLKQAEQFKGRLSEGADTLLGWFDYSEAVLKTLGKLRVYAGMAFYTDANDQEGAARHDRARGLAAQVAEAFAFALPELLDIGPEKLIELTEEDARLAPYRHAFERLAAFAPHARSKEVEELLAALSDPFGTATSAHNMLANADLDFGDAVDADGEAHPIRQGTIRTLLGSSDRQLRQSAYEAYADAHLGAKHSMATILSAGVKQTLLLARTRRYDSALAAALEPEKLPLSVFHTLIDTFKKNLPTWHRYWRAKRRLLGLDRLHPFDVFAPLTEAAPEVSFEQSVDWLSEALAPLGEAYVGTMRRGALEERWVDYAVNEGKRMGAFSSGVQGTYPFIMMSYTDDVFGMSTLAHELGHSMHSYLSWQTQPFVYSDYSLFVAEVASNFNQAMLRAYLFDQDPDRDTQLALIDEAFANFYRYFFVMPTLARFELDIHERIERGEALSAEDMNDLMRALYAEGYGGEIELDEPRVGITWAQFHTHLYARFYVYQYATGISGAHALAREILDGEAGAAERYLDFLKAGGSKYPLDALKDAGVDLSSPEPVEETFAVLAALVERLESLIEA